HFCLALLGGEGSKPVPGLRDGSRGMGHAGKAMEIRIRRQGRIVDIVVVQKYEERVVLAGGHEAQSVLVDLARVATADAVLGDMQAIEQLLQALAVVGLRKGAGGGLEIILEVNEAAPHACTAGEEIGAGGEAGSAITETLECLPHGGKMRQETGAHVGGAMLVGIEASEHGGVRGQSP